MPISNSYPRGVPIEDQDLFVGTKAANNRTVNYTAQGVADYLNINSKVAIGGQMSFQFTIVPNIPKTIAFEGGLGDGTAFSAITKLIVSAIDLSTADITIFLNYLNNSQVLLSQQNQPNNFGHYKITGYTQIGTSAFYELDLEFIGGNGTIGDKQYYDLVSFVLSTEAPVTEWGSITGDIEDQTDLIDYISSQITTPTLQQVLDNNHNLINGNNFQGTTAGLGATGFNINAFGTNAALFNTGDALNALGNTSGNNNSGDNVNAFGDFAGNGNTFDYVNLLGQNAAADENGQTVLSKDGAIMARISTADLTDTRKYNLPDADGTIALTSDLTTPTLQEVLDEGDAAVDSAIFFSNTANDFETSVNEFGDGQINLKSVVNDTLTTIGAGQVYLGTVDGSDNVIISKDGINVDTVNYAFPSGTSSPLATLADIPSGGVTSVTATSPITSSGGATPVISTSMATNKLIGRSTAGTGVMEEITVGTGLTLSGGTLNATAQTVGFEQNFLLMGS